MSGSSVDRWVARGDGAVNALRLRKAMGRFATGVTIVTTVKETQAGRDVHGMTATAFTSVSLNPPLVLVSVSTIAKMDKRISETGRYGVSILSGDQEWLSRHFSGVTQRPEPITFVWRVGLPLVAGALVHLACKVRDSHAAGDHTLHVGEVEGLWDRDGGPLVFYASRLCPLPIVTPYDLSASW